LEFTRAAIDRTGNLPPMPGIFPDYEALVVQNTQAGHELVMMRWGPPSSRR
jgi:putative SOS response-associated peptidase YedK